MGTRRKQQQVSLPPRQSHDIRFIINTESEDNCLVHLVKTLAGQISVGITTRYGKADALGSIKEFSHLSPKTRINAYVSVVPLRESQLPGDDRAWVVVTLTNMSWSRWAEVNYFGAMVGPGCLGDKENGEWVRGMMHGAMAEQLDSVLARLSYGNESAYRHDVMARLAMGTAESEICSLDMNSTFASSASSLRVQHGLIGGQAGRTMGGRVCATMALLTSSMALLWTSSTRRMTGLLVGVLASTVCGWTGGSLLGARVGERKGMEMGVAGEAKVHAEVTAASSAAFAGVAIGAMAWFATELVARLATTPPAPGGLDEVEQIDEVEHVNGEVDGTHQGGLD